MKAYVYANSEKCDQEELSGVLGHLRTRGVDPFCFWDSESRVINFDGNDFVVVMGGDGSILHACQCMGRNQIPVVGINFGKLGYMANFSLGTFAGHLDEILEIIKNPGAHPEGISERTMLWVKGENFESLAINDVVLDIGEPFRAITYEIWINGNKLSTVTGDGIIVSTPTGSTAYNLSANGPIVQPELGGIALTPKNIHGMSIRPIVVRDDQTIRLVVRKPVGAWAIVDGQQRWALASNPDDVVQKEITVTQFPKKMLLVNNPEIDYWRTLNEKLNWGR